MNIRDASVAIDENKFTRAIGAHLGACLLELNATREELDNPLIEVDVELDGEVRMFEIKHVLTHDFAISGVVLQSVIVDHDGQEPTQLMYAFVLLTVAGIIPLQRIGVGSERHAIDNHGEVTAKAVEILFS